MAKLIADGRLVDAINVAGLAAAEDLAHHMAQDGFDDFHASDWPIMRLLLASGPISASAMSGPLGISQQATSKAVFFLQCRDYVDRVVSSEDRRVRNVMLTARAHAAIEAGARWAADHQTHAIERWGSPEVQRVTTVLTEFAQACERFPGVGRDLRFGR